MPETRPFAILSILIGSNDTAVQSRVPFNDIYARCHATYRPDAKIILFFITTNLTSLN